MKTILYSIVAIALIAAAFYFFNSPAQAPVPAAQEQAQTTPTSATTDQTGTTVAISISNFSFDPSVLNFKKGDTVTWTNNDAVPHQIASASFTGPVINKGQTYSFTFDSMGTFDYHCAIHPSMKGTIIVK